MKGKVSIRALIRDVRAQATLMNTAVMEQDKKTIIGCLDGIEAITMKIRKVLED